MKRRDFITLLGGAAAWPLAARAQQAKLPTIGFFSPNRASAQSEWTEAFVQRLRELDWVEGRNISIEYRWAEGRTERLAEIAAELVRRRVDVIVTQGGAAVLAAKQATSVIPVIFAVAGDPVATGLVTSLARPGGNVTGLSLLNTELVGKRLELLRELVPNLRHLAVVVDVGFPDGVLEMGDLRTLAGTLGLEVTTLEIRRAEDIVPAFETLKGRAEALYVVGAPLLTTGLEFSSFGDWSATAHRFTISGSTSTRVVSCPMGPIFRICSGAPPSMSTRFCVGRSRATFRSSSRPSSISWLAWLRRKRWAFPCRRRLARADEVIE